MACWNRVTAHVVQGPARRARSRALCYARKVPLIYGRAGLNNWQAFADSKVASVSPRGTQPVLGHRSASPPAPGSAPTPRRASTTGRRRTSRRALRPSSTFTGRPEPPRRGPAAVRLLDRAADAARAELGRPRGLRDRPDRPHGQQGGRRLRPGARHPRLEDQPLELRLRARADLDLRPVRCTGRSRASRSTRAASRSATWRSRTPTRRRSPTPTARSTRAYRAVQDLPSPLVPIAPS